MHSVAVKKSQTRWFARLMIGRHGTEGVQPRFQSNVSHLHFDTKDKQTGEKVAYIVERQMLPRQTKRTLVVGIVVGIVAGIVVGILSEWMWVVVAMSRRCRRRAYECKEPRLAWVVWVTTLFKLRPCRIKDREAYASLSDA